MRYFLGVDTGATKSHALIADEKGRILGFGHGGPGSWEAVGWEGARLTLSDVIGQALTAADLRLAQITAAGFGLAGYDWPEDRPNHEAIIQAIGLTVPYGLVNDALIGLLAGSSAGWGVAVVAGTGCNCYGRDRQGKIGRAVGSSRFGEYAGAGELVWQAVQAVAHAWSCRGPATRLTEAFIAIVGAQDAADLLAGLHRGRYRLSAEHAPVIFAAAAAGDAVAADLLQWAGRELAGLALGVARQLDLLEQPFELILSGSFYNGGPVIQERMAAAIQPVAPQAQLRRLAAPPVVGAVLLAMEQVGWETAVARPILNVNAQKLLTALEGR
jgi:N-acetylglucosamine kinase-like BadF-type ATPase